MKEIKLGMVGTNFVSDWMADAAKAVDGIAPAAVYSRTLEKGKEFAQKHSVPAVFTDYGEMLESDIDAVYIANPNKFHYSFALEAIEHGKHVLVEKPATLTRAEYESLMQAAKEQGVVILEAIRPIHDPLLRKAKEKMAELAPIRHAVLEYCQYSSRYGKFKAGIVENAFDPSFGNAAVMDIGVYALHTAVYLFGVPDRLTARSEILHNGMEACGTAVLGYDGFTATVIYSKVHDSQNPSCIAGEGGALLLGKLNSVDSAELVLRSGEREVLGRDRSEHNMIYILRDLVSCVKGELDAGEFNSLTAAVMGLIDTVRSQNGIVF